MGLNRSGATWPGFKDVLPAAAAGLDLPDAPSLGGRGLFRGSVNAVVEEEGVVMGDWAASLDALACDGDEVPSFDSLFFDLEDLFGSFARESCSC